MPQAPQSAARAAGPAVHSLDHFAFTVPDLDEAARFYSEFGLDVRRVDGRVDLYTFGHPHRWGSIHRGPGRKKLQYLCFGAYADDIEPLRERLARMRVVRREPHPLAQAAGVWCEDPQGVAVQVIAGPKVSPGEKKPIAWPSATPGKGACPGRSTSSGAGLEGDGIGSDHAHGRPTIPASSPRAVDQGTTDWSKAPLKAEGCLDNPGEAPVGGSKNAISRCSISPSTANSGAAISSG